jgi:hypothetical protein
MKQKHNIRNLSLELRERIEKELLDPLSVLERTSGSGAYPRALVDKVFQGFRKTNDCIWEKFQEKINNGNGKVE